MLLPRIIPCLDVKDGRTVKGVQFEDLRDVGSPQELAHRYEQQGADELVLLDITATLEARAAMISIVREVAGEIFVPLTVGGGIDSLERIERLLRAGADKVSLNSAALKDPDLVSRAAKHFGTQCITVAIDVKRVADNKSSEGNDGSGFGVFSHGGTRATGRDAIAWAKEAQARGAGELLATSMDCDGRQQGFDRSLLVNLAEAVSVPIVASGGAGEMKHFFEVLQIPRVTGALAASLFHDAQLSIPQLKSYLTEQGMKVRRTHKDEN